MGSARSYGKLKSMKVRMQINMVVIFLPLMKSDMKLKVRGSNFAQPVGKHRSDFIRGKKNCCHMLITNIATMKWQQFMESDLK